MTAPGRLADAHTLGARPARRPGRLALLGGIVVSLGISGAAAAWTHAPGLARTVVIDIRYSHYEPAEVTVPLGVPVTVVLRNGDPIDHEWIVGEEAVHERHRLGTEPVHASRPTEITIPAGETRATTITFTKDEAMRYICHLPGHEAYGMVGVLLVDGGA